MASITVVVESWLPARSEVNGKHHKLGQPPAVGDLLQYQGRLIRVWGLRPRRGDRLEVHAEELTWRSGHSVPQVVSPDLTVHTCERCSAQR